MTGNNAINLPEFKISITNNCSIFLVPRFVARRFVIFLKIVKEACMISF